jgi:hypothetical protein
MRGEVPSTLRAASRIASGQHGVVTYRQLLAAGVSRQTVDRWVAKGILHRVHRGVYRFGHSAPSEAATYLAAVKACGDEARLAGPPAAYLYGLIGGPAPAPEVTSAADRRHPGIKTRIRTLDPLDAATYRGIPILTVPATLVDVAATLSLDALSLACHRAEVTYRVRAETVSESLARRNGVRGAANLRAIIHGDHRLLLSKLEREFLAFLDEDRLPLPHTNRRKGRHYVDCRWSEYRLTVELDSFTFHHSRYAWEQDRERERAARARGDEFRRYTWRDVVEDRAHIRRDLRILLSPARATGPPAAAA